MEERKWIRQTADDSVEFARFALKLFKDVVLENKAYLDLVLSDAYKLQSYYMGMVDENKRVNFYDGTIRVVGPKGKVFADFKTDDVGREIRLCF